MRVLVTGSSGWLGRTLVPRLRAAGHEVRGLDPVPGPFTDHVGSAGDRSLVRAAFADGDIAAVIHAGALHKPDIGPHSHAAFVETNVQGTLNLLEESVAHGVARFVFTSTTSLMISKEIRAGLAGGAREAVWLDEEAGPLRPRNIYGVTKLAAENLCRMVHDDHGLPVMVLRTSRFFPEADDMAHAIEQSDANTKVNELLFRRLTVEDAAEAHLIALDRAPALGHGVFIISAPTPFQRSDCAELIDRAPDVVARYFPDYPDIYRRLGWTMFRSIDRVYDASKAARVLGFTCRATYADKLRALADVREAC
ncbi:MAG: NAD(P)-dependent oxidoreductase [Caulobacterales bacterium]|nr:NAD(P)-dependent oxidoreductase [Caulobacterales bacterium]